jgi:uncharacterized protein (TIGR02466 family)
VRYGEAMPNIRSLFVTRLYHAKLAELGPPVDAEELHASCFSIAEDDEAGQDWCEENGYPGYTSYASLTDLPWRFPIFDALVKALDAHVAAFARTWNSTWRAASWCWRISGSTSFPRAVSIPPTSTPIR